MWNIWRRGGRTVRGFDDAGDFVCFYIAFRPSILIFSTLVRILILTRERTNEFDRAFVTISPLMTNVEDVRDMKSSRNSERERWSRSLTEKATFLLFPLVLLCNMRKRQITCIKESYRAYVCQCAREKHISHCQYLLDNTRDANETTRFIFILHI